ncbi:hypothetical protein JMJ55_19035 [Belnapia sp. T6]|uniref:Uncharacterized protein n=1 Tax=Belnapia mucosa TaxID=2804532 RepID=A0ABS1V7U2_9PROT|nr:hypothetical protein [Belnapia mucosa]MBL6457432.1 hypothetical protein [Belnapia mucosa]
MHDEGILALVLSADLFVVAFDHLGIGRVIPDAVLAYFCEAMPTRLSHADTP